MQLVWIDTCEQGKIAGDHQPLDMVGIGLIARLFDTGLDAGHFGIRGPVEIRKRPGGVQCIAVDIIRPLAPIDAAHIFAPADDLTDKAFRRVEGGAALTIFGLDRAAHFERIEEAAIEIE